MTDPTEREKQNVAWLREQALFWREGGYYNRMTAVSLAADAIERGEYKDANPDPEAP